LVTGIVFDIKKFSIHDGPGIRTTVFFKGCPLRCTWCHNPESQSLARERMFRASRCIRCGGCLATCSQGAISWNGRLPVTDDAKCTLCGDCVGACFAEAREIVGQEMSVAQVMAEVERDVAFYDQSGGGVTFSGGEPLTQPDFLLALLRACQEQEIHTVLDTCGYAAWETLDRVRGYVDLFLYDLKVMDDAKHRQFTGVSNERILGNLRALAERGHKIILRMPVIPGVNDDEESVRQIGRFAASLPQVRRVDLLPYHHTAADKYERLERAYALVDARPLSDKRMADLARVLQKLDIKVKIGG
jgi:pyruvate formate lyase activating enzyme